MRWRTCVSLSRRLTLFRFFFAQDEAYNRVHAGCLAASARLGDSTLAVVGLLHRGAAAAPAGEFRAVVLHLRMLAEKDLDSIDFFWPQVCACRQSVRRRRALMRAFSHACLCLALSSQPQLRFVG